MAQSSGQKPFFRYDLETTAIAEDGNRYVDVKDPGGRSFRFYEVEYAVACGMDGNRDVRDIVEWAKVELELQTNSSEVSAIVEKLSELKYLEFAERSSTVPDSIEMDSSIEIDSMDYDDVLESDSSGSIADIEVPKNAMIMSNTSSGNFDELTVAGSSLEMVSGQYSGGGSDYDDVDATVVSDSLASDSLASDSLASDSLASNSPPDVSGDIELGHPGKSDFPTEDKNIPISMDMELGKSGDIHVQKSAPSKLGSDVELGASGNDELTASKQEVRRTAPTKEKASTSKNIAESLFEKDASDTEGLEESSNKVSGDKAIVLPESPEKLAKKKAATAIAEKVANKEKAPKLVSRSASLLLWFLLLVVVALAAAYYYLNYVKEEVKPATKARVITPKAVVAPPVPMAPKSIWNVLDLETQEVIATRAGVITWAVDDGAEVLVGDTLVKLSGYERAAKALEKDQKSLLNYQNQLAVAQKANKPRKISSLEKNINRKNTEITDSFKKMEEFVLKSKMSGVSNVVPKMRSRIKVEDVLGKITSHSAASVVFSLEGNLGLLKERSVEVDSTLEIKTIGEESELVECKVTAFEEGQLTLQCPNDSDIANETKVELVL